MRARILSLAFVIAGVSAATLKADPPSTSDFDFKKINDVIREAMEPVVAARGLISKFTYSIDPKETNLEQDRYAVDMEVVAEDPWSDETFDSNIHLVVGQDTSGAEAVLNVLADVSVSTDGLAFVRHHAEKSRACDKEAKVSGALRVALSEDCKVAPRLANVQSFDELHQILKDHIEAAKTAMSSYHADLVKANAIVENEITKQSLRLQIEESERYLKGASEVKLTRTVDGVQITIKDFPLLGMAEIKSIDADVSTAKVRIKGEGSTSFGTKIINAAKPELLRILRSLEQGEDYVKTLTQMETRFWLRLMEDHISK